MVARGFTIIELVVVMAILSILATMTLPLAELSVRRSKERELRAALSEIRSALDRYKAMADAGRIALPPNASGYPLSLTELVQGATDTRTGSTLYFLRRIPQDPFETTNRPGWGLRSYASPPDKPQRGADVFDIYSQSDKVGLNGVAYAKW